MQNPGLKLFQCWLLSALPVLSGASSSQVSAVAETAEDNESEPDPRTRHGQRILLKKLLVSTLTHLCRHSSAVECLLRLNDLPLLFGAISSPCPPYNKMWRKAAADCLLAIFRYSCVCIHVLLVHVQSCYKGFEVEMYMYT